MRVLTIGLGGAGSRIVDRLYDHDRRSNVLSMNALAIDLDANTLTQLEHLPKESKLFFPPIDPSHPFDVKTTIDIEEVMTRVQRMDTVQMDAILICAGLGGTMVETMEQIVPDLRETFIEPVFAVVTLPCRGEGTKRSAKAADDLEMVDALVDATIVFDNETWYRKVRAGEEAGPVTGHRGGRNRTYARNPKLVNSLLNEQIARRIGLLLRAGEFSENGLEVGELVLDAGEVLNTLSGMGTVAVGYAVDRLPKGTFDFLKRRSSARNYMEGSQTRAARIVSLAKRAVYQEISVPCDMTSAQKALVLVAGPDPELSMKGFATVRKWIDRSIAGLEVRSGDYPVKNTDFVGIIIVLSGVQNVPRIEELKILREQYLLELEEERYKAASEEAGGEMPEEGDDPLALPQERVEDMTEERDEMIRIAADEKKPVKKNQGEESDVLRLHLSSDKLKRKAEESDAVVLPTGKRQAPRDITRMTNVAMPQAPKEASSGRGRSGIAAMRPKEVELAGVKVDTLPAAKDGAFSGQSVSLKSAIKKAKDDLFEGKSVSLSTGGALPNDDLMKASAKIAPKQKPKEVEPGKRVLSSEKSHHKKEGGEDDTIDWIR
ncbi:MAG: tubulin-like protein CetZ [Methanofollis sp.]|nr:tubulin-like protein CetZ [Methanofollis sp.]